VDSVVHGKSQIALVAVNRREWGAQSLKDGTKIEKVSYAYGDDWRLDHVAALVDGGGDEWSPSLRSSP